VNPAHRSTWARLWESHRAESTERAAVDGVRSRLWRLAGEFGVERSAPHLFTRAGGARRCEYSLRGDALALPPTDAISKGALGVRFIAERGAVVQFDVRLEAVSAAGQPVVLAVHRDPEPRGLGACGHALGHCHVGPDLDSRPKVRLPFPAGDPLSALDWVLASAIPAWEPAPWEQLARI